MKTRFHSLAVVSALALVAFASCSQSPQPVDAPAGNPAAPAELGVAGTIVFEGAAFDAPTGTLFVSIRPKGIKMPWLSRKYDIAGDAAPKSESGAKILPFALSPNDHITFNASPGQTPSVECEICAAYKENGDAMSKTLVQALAPYQPGKTDYTLTLKLP